MGKKTSKQSAKQTSTGFRSILRSGNISRSKASQGTRKRPLTASVGDIFAIRLKPKAYALAKSVFVAKNTKGLMAIRIFNSTLPSLEMPIGYPDAYIDKTFWTGTQSLINGRWRIIGNSEITDADIASTIYAVVGAVVQGETRLRRATKTDLDQYPGQVISPNNFIESKLRRRLLK